MICVRVRSYRNRLRVRVRGSNQFNVWFGYMVRVRGSYFLGLRVWSTVLGLGLGFLIGGV